MLGGRVVMLGGLGEEHPYRMGGVRG